MAQVTLKQIAKGADTSIRTVTRALKRQNGVSKIKRTEILRLANEMGYVPNIAARNLRLRKSNFVGIIGGDIGRESVFLRKANDLQQKLKQNGYYPVLGGLPKNEDLLKDILREWAGFVSTVIFYNYSISNSPEMFAGLPQHFIFVDASPVAGCYHLDINRASGVHDGVLHLLQTGRRCIVRCGSVDVGRKDGFDQAFDSFSQSEKPRRIHLPTVKCNFKEGYSMAEKILASGADAVFFDTDRMAFGFLKYAWEKRIEIPGQIAVIGFDDDPWGKLSCPALSTVAHPIEELSEAIITLIEQLPENPATLTFDTKFIRRESA